MLISVVIDKDIAPTATAPASADVDIGVSLPLEGIKGTVSVQSVSGTAIAHLTPGDYTVSVVDDNTVNIAAVAGATALADGDVVNIAVICRGEIARP